MSQLSYPEKVKQAEQEWYTKRAERLGVSVDAQCINGVELSELCDSLPKPKHGDRWGDWVLNLSLDPLGKFEPDYEPSLDYVGGGHHHNPYWIPLSQLDSWPGLNRWMDHLWGKTWGQETMGDFVRAVMTIFEFGFPGNNQKAKSNYLKS